MEKKAVMGVLHLLVSFLLFGGGVEGAIPIPSRPIGPAECSKVSPGSCPTVCPAHCRRCWLKQIASNDLLSLLTCLRDHRYNSPLRTAGMDLSLLLDLIPPSDVGYTYSAPHFLEFHPTESFGEYVC